MEDENINYNKHKNVYICSRCNTTYHDRSLYKQHITRLRSCGKLVESDILPDLQYSLSKSLYKYEDIQKSINNKKKLNDLVRKMDGQIKAILRVGSFDISKQREYLQELNRIKNEISNIV